jgi:hypothetical protein
LGRIHGYHLVITGIQSSISWDFASLAWRTATCINIDFVPGQGLFSCGKLPGSIKGGAINVDVIGSLQGCTSNDLGLSDRNADVG